MNKRAIYMRENIQMLLVSLVVCKCSLESVILHASSSILNSSNHMNYKKKNKTETCSKFSFTTQPRKINTNKCTMLALLGTAVKMQMKISRKVRGSPKSLGYIL